MVLFNFFKKIYNCTNLFGSRKYAILVKGKIEFVNAPNIHIAKLEESWRNNNG
jgi:hypothetical protein